MVECLGGKFVGSINCQFLGFICLCSGEAVGAEAASHISNQLKSIAYTTPESIL